MFSKPPGFLNSDHDEKKINTEKTTKATLSRESSVFIPGLFSQGLFMNPTFEGKSLKEEMQKKGEKVENNNRYMSCPVTPDNTKIDSNGNVGCGINNQKNYHLFEKKTMFTENFKKKFENMNILYVLDKFMNNLFLEENIKKMKKKDLEKLEFLTKEEKEKISFLLSEIKGFSGV